MNKNFLWLNLTILFCTFCFLLLIVNLEFAIAETESVSFIIPVFPLLFGYAVYKSYKKHNS